MSHWMESWGMTAGNGGGGLPRGITAGNNGGMAGRIAQFSLSLSEVHRRSLQWLG
ncbi:MAG: hypothetical protein ACK52S_23500 [Pirellula sp.]